jgi:hypothetical protein
MTTKEYMRVVPAIDTEWFVVVVVERMKRLFCAER